MEIEPEKFWPQYNVHKIFRVGVGVETRVGRVSGNNTIFRPYSTLADGRSRGLHCRSVGHT